MIRLFNADSLAAMKAMPDKDYDLAIVDPPYGIGNDGQKEDKRPTGSGKYHASKWTRKRYDFKGWDVAPGIDYFNELRRVTENQIIWGGNYFTAFLPSVKAWVFWYKGQHDLTMSDGEMAWTSFDKVTRQFELNRMALTLEKTIHPTQKPVALYKWLLTHYAKPGDKILDTHGGSGSICIACHDLGFDLDWYEIDAEYFQAAKERLERHQRQEMLPLEIPPQPIQGVL